MDVTKGIHYQDRCVVTPPLQVNETTSSALWLWYFWQRKGFRNPSVFGHHLVIYLLLQEQKRMYSLSCDDEGQIVERQLATTSDTIHNLLHS